MDKINLDELRSNLARNPGNEEYAIAMALIAIAQELRVMNQRAQDAIDISEYAPTADEVKGRWRGV